MPLEKDTCKKYLDKLRGELFKEECKTCEGKKENCEDYRPIGGRGLFEYLSDDKWD